MTQKKNTKKDNAACHTSPAAAQHTVQQGFATAWVSYNKIEKVEVTLRRERRKGRKKKTKGICGCPYHEPASSRQLHQTATLSLG